MIRLKSFLKIFFVLVIFISCQTSKLSTRELHIYEDGSEMIAETKSIINEVSISDFRSNYYNNDHVYIIDVRTGEEFENGNIEAAVSIPRGVLELRISYEDFWSEKGTLPPGKDSTIILYCGSGGRSALATKTLMQLGYKNVLSLKGGWNAWIESDQ